MVNRRQFIETFLKSVAIGPCLYRTEVLGQQLGAAARINRETLVKRHNPRLSKIDPLSPLSVGNGEFAFTADVTGLQTLSAAYNDAMPLCTMSQWGWHSTPRPTELLNKTLRLVDYDTHGRKVGYQTSSEGQQELYTWLRENPHRLHLGQISLCFGNSSTSSIQATEITGIDQGLDLWRGLLTSRFELRGEPVKTTVVAHPKLDLLAVRVESGLIGSEQLSIRIAFPYGSPTMQAANWNESQKHQTKQLTHDANGALLERRLDQNSYFVRVNWRAGGAIFTEVASHTFVLSSSTPGQLEFVIAFSPKKETHPLPTFGATARASEDQWRRFWLSGAAVDLSESKDKRAPELERRIVLSQYLTAIQCAGTMPPQETGLTVNSWYGKFHLEMHWWHATHFALWDRVLLFEKSLSWYNKILPGAKELARSQGYAGARWPKMVGPEGIDSPSPIGPLLIWQQPHPIFYAELCYQSHPDRKTLAQYRDIVFESATFMASYPHLDEKTKRYVLGPPLIPAQENHPPRETWNPTYELVYWAYGLNVAQHWRERLGLKRNPDWDRIIKNLAPLPTRDGVYLAHENCPQTFTERNRDHPSMLAAYTYFPAPAVDRETMRRTLRKTMDEWKWADTWGWDYPMVAMTAARLGEPKIAVDALLMETEKNRYLPNGHNWQRQNLPCYLPGNGGLLFAVAMMAAGWSSTREHVPGFPADGSWRVTAEGFKAKQLLDV